MRLGKFLGERTGPGHSLEPPWPMLFDAEFGAMDQVRFTEHTDQSALFIKDWKGTDVVFSQEFDGFAHVHLRADGDDVAHHDIDRTHLSCLRIGGRTGGRGPPTTSSPSARSAPTQARCCGSSTIVAPTH